MPSLTRTLLFCDNGEILPGFALSSLLKACFDISAAAATQTVESMRSSGGGQVWFWLVWEQCVIICIRGWFTFKYIASKPVLQELLPGIKDHAEESFCDRETNELFLQLAT